MTLFLEPPFLLKASVFFLVCAATAYFDVSRRRVPNWLIVLGFMLGAVLMSGVPETPVFAGNIGTALAASLVAFLAFLPFYAFRAMGAADVKFFALLAFWFASVPSMLFVFVASGLMLGLHIGLAALYSPEFRLSLRQRGRVTVPESGPSPIPQRRIVNGQPYAAYMAAAAVLYLFVRF